MPLYFSIRASATNDGTLSQHTVSTAEILKYKFKFPFHILKQIIIIFSLIFSDERLEKQKKRGVKKGRWQKLDHST